MSGDLQGGRRLGPASRLRDASLALLQREGRQNDKGTVNFEPHTPENPYPRLSLSLMRHPVDGSLMLSVWAMRKDKYGKV